MIEEEEYVVCFGIQVRGAKTDQFTLDPKEFGEMAEEWARKYSVPCSDEATIIALSMLRSKWESYEDAEVEDA